MTVSEKVIVNWPKLRELIQKEVVTMVYRFYEHEITEEELPKVSREAAERVLKEAGYPE